MGLARTQRGTRRDAREPCCAAGRFCCHVSALTRRRCRCVIAQALHLKELSVAHGSQPVAMPTLAERRDAASPSLSPVNPKRGHDSSSPPAGPPSLTQTPRTARRGDDEPEPLEVHDWVRTTLLFLEKNGQDILQAICSRYKIPFDRSVSSIPIGTWEQVRHLFSCRCGALACARLLSPALDAGTKTTSRLSARAGHRLRTCCLPPSRGVARTPV